MPYARAFSPESQSGKHYRKTGTFLHPIHHLNPKYIFETLADARKKEGPKALIGEVVLLDQAAHPPLRAGAVPVCFLRLVE